jgi:prophage antirepressor-like protein
MSEDQRLALFQKKEIRKQLHGGEWWFVITDVIRALTDSSNPAQYLQNVRRRDEELPWRDKDEDIFSFARRCIQFSQQENLDSSSRFFFISVQTSRENFGIV